MKDKTSPSRTGPIRVLMLATRVPVRSGDGTPSFILDSALALPEIRFTIVAPRSPGSARVERHGHVEVRRFGSSLSGWRSLSSDAIMPQLARQPWRWWQALALSASMILAAIREHQRLRPDVVHAQWIVPSGVVAAILGMLFRTPYIVTSRGADAFTMPHKGIEAVRRSVIRRSSVFLAVSTEILQRFEAFAPRSGHLPSGVDFDGWSARVGVRRPEPHRLLFVGRLAEKKGLEVLFRALVGVEKATLRVAGDGPSRRGLESLADQLDLSERIQFLGRCDRARIAEEYRTASCIVIPSVVASDGDREGTPNVLGEAAASGVPIVASATGGIRDLVVHDVHALLSPAGDFEGLANNLRRLLEDESLAGRIAQAARSTLREKLDVQIVATRQHDWYLEVADAR